MTSWVAYRYFTGEARLRRFAELWLEQFSGGEAVVEKARFDLFAGLQLSGVTLAILESANFDPHDHSLSARKIFSSDALFLRIRPFSIISGNLVVPEIVAINPQLFLVHRVSDGVGNWQAMMRRRQWRSSGRSPQLPVIRLRNVRVGQYRLDERGRSGGAPQIFYVDAQTRREPSNVYDVKVAKLIPMTESGELTGEIGRLQIDMKTLAVAGSLPSLSIDELLFSAPQAVVRWLDILDLRGHVRADTFQYDPDQGGQATLALRDAALSIPISTDEENLPPAHRYIQFKRIAGSIRFDGQRAFVALDGRFREHPITVNGELVLPKGMYAVSLDTIGFEIELKVSGLPMPRDDADADASEVRFVRRWKRLRNFVEDFGAIGPVDLTMRLRKLPGADKVIEFMEGALIPRGTSAAYYKFPYRVYGMGGAVWFRRDGSIDLENLGGTHGDGPVIVNGRVGGFLHTDEARLEIVGRNIVLDDDLRRCLSEQDQLLWEQFNLAGRVNIRVQMHRKQAEANQPPSEWKNVIDVQFLDGAVSFDAFRYPLSNLTGSMRIAEGQFTFNNLRAGRGETVVQMSGVANRSDDKRTQVDLQLVVTDLPLDDVLANALPPDARAMYTRFSPTGKAQLTGRLFTPPDNGPIEYDLSAMISDARLSLTPSSVQLSQIEAKLRIVPRRLTLESLRAKLDDANVVLDGFVALATHDPSMSVHLRVDKLRLDTALRGTLTSSLQKVWDLFRPDGRIRLELQYDRTVSSAPSAGKTGPDVDYRATVEPLGCSATFSSFPLPLTNVNGHFVVTPTGVEITNTTARHQNTEFRLAGRVRLAPDATRVKLAVTARRLAFSEALRQAVPWRLRRLWNDVQPTGEADLFLEELEFTLKPGTLSPWRFQGSMKLNKVGLLMGPELSDITGQVKASGQVGDFFSVNGEIALSRVRVDDRLVTNLKARTTRPIGDPVFQVTDILGDFCSGQIIGRAEIDYSPGGPKYGISLTARDISLERFLNAKCKPGDKPIKLKGRVEGNLALAGRLSDVRSRRGGGTILIREAQMLKVPLLLAILQVIHFAIDDDNAFHDAMFNFIVDGDELILDQIDLRGKSLSLVGAGTVHTPTQILDLVLLIGSPLRLPRLEILSELMEGVARELVEVHVEGTLEKPTYRAEIVRSLRKTLETILNVQRSDRQ